VSIKRPVFLFLWLLFIAGLTVVSLRAEPVGSTLNEADWQQIQRQLPKRASSSIAGGEVILGRPDPSIQQQFGWSVAAYGDVVAVGASGDTNVAQAAKYAGSAYIFERNAGGTNAWGLVQKLYASDPVSSGFFGSGIALDGDVLVVGAYGVSGSRGAAYVFERNAGGTNAWQQVQKLLASDGIGLDFFGSKVAISGDIILAGANGQDTMGNGAGAVYVFERNANGTNAWGQSKKLMAADGSHSAYFGQSVSVRGDVAVIGANGA